MKALVATLLLALPTVAMATQLDCNNNQDVAGFRIELNGRDLSVSTADVDDKSAAETYFGQEPKVTFDPKYRPTAKHAGSIQFKGQNDEGEYKLVLNKALVDNVGADMLMVYETLSDSDGGPASIVVFRCHALK